MKKPYENPIVEFLSLNENDLFRTSVNSYIDGNADDDAWDFDDIFTGG